MKKFEERLKSRMNELNMKQVDIVRKTGLSKTSVSRWLNGSVPRGEALTILAEGLKVSPEWLMGKSETSNSLDIRWGGPGAQPERMRLPNASIVPKAIAQNGDWHLTGEVTLLANAMTHINKGPFILYDIGSSIQGTDGKRLLVSVGVTGMCSEIKFKPIEGGLYIVNWHGQVLMLNITLTGAGDLRVSSENGFFREELIKAADIPRAEVRILGEVIVASHVYA